MGKMQRYDDAVKIIKDAILQSQYEAARSVNEKQLMLYYGIGKYISLNSREGFWGEGAIAAISEKLQKELPGLRGFSVRNLRNMRYFYEEWSILDGSSPIFEDTNNYNLAVASAKIEDKEVSGINWQLQLPKDADFPLEKFLSIGFTNHITVLSKVKNYDERIFYIRMLCRKRYCKTLLVSTLTPLQSEMP